MKDSIFDPVYLYYSKDGVKYVPTDFGLRKFFTVQTQHFYGTDSEILYALNVLDSVPDELAVVDIFDILVMHNTQIMKAMFDGKIDAIQFTKPDDRIYDDTIAEMKRILKLLDIEYEEGLDYNEMHDRYFEKSKHFDVSNYFYFFRVGRETFYHYQKQEALIKEYLKQKEETSSI